MSLLDNCNLPKWPQMYVSGAPVTTDQAKEILRRTDSFIVRGHGGNDHAWNRHMAARLRMPHYWDFSADQAPRNWREYSARCDAWHAKWGTLETQYVHNSWMSSSYIFGPYGWCHPNGHIGYVDNVGKWPSAEDVFADWASIAAAFPFLHLAVTLMDREHTEDGPQPVVSFLVDDGLVTVAEGSMRWHEPYPRPEADRSTEAMMARFNGFDWNSREHGPIPSSWYDDWERTALEVDAALRDFVYLDEDCIEDSGDVDDGWRKENARREREAST